MCTPSFLSAFKVLFSMSQRNQGRAGLTGFLNFAVNTSAGKPRSRPGGYVASDRIQLLANELEKTQSLLGL